MTKDLAAGIVETANSLGMRPQDLATIISYETAGTFDPTKRGPTTQWGQHRGFIQFGEPQAKQYGVNWDDPVNSQLGPQGAIANYFRSNGWRPGMGLLDAYSIVNAGGPGLYNRSDANNGGAPGTVADKVNNQMAGHARNAAALLGGQASQGAPSPRTHGPDGVFGDRYGSGQPQGGGFTQEQIAAAMGQAKQPQQAMQAPEAPQMQVAPMQPREGYQSNNDALANAMRAMQALQQRRKGLLG